MTLLFPWQIHCPNPEKFPRFAAGFQGRRCKLLGLTLNQDFERVSLDTGDIINVQPNWLRKAK